VIMTSFAVFRITSPCEIMEAPPQSASTSTKSVNPSRKVKVCGAARIVAAAVYTVCTGLSYRSLVYSILESPATGDVES
jgi:hypothetical protein